MRKEVKLEALTLVLIIIAITVVVVVAVVLIVDRHVLIGCWHATSVEGRPKPRQR